MPNRKPYLLFVLAFLVSALTKLLSLHSRELWLDETYSAFVANLHLPELAKYVTGDEHPPLFHVLLWAWVRCVGEAQSHLRLFSVVVNLFAMVAMFFLARRAVGLRMGSFAATLFAFSPMLFVYSLEVRSYMLFLLIFICLLHLHWMLAVERRGSARLLAGYGVLAATLFYTHYLAVFLISGLLLHWVLVSLRARLPLQRVFVAGLLMAILIAPGLPLLLGQRSRGAAFYQEQRNSFADPTALTYRDGQSKSPGDAAPKSRWVKSAAAMVGMYPARSSILLGLCAIPFLAALAGAGYLGLWKSDPVCQLCLLVAAMLAAGVFFLRVDATRYILPLVPLVVLAMARAVQAWMQTKRWHVAGLVGAVLLVCLSGAGFFRQATMHHGQPWRDLITALQQQYRPGDEVVFDVAYAQVPFDYHARQLGFSARETGFPISIYTWWDQQPLKGWTNPVISVADLDRFGSGLSSSTVRTVWLVSNETQYYDPKQSLLARLRTMGTVTEVTLPADPDARLSTDGSHTQLYRVDLKHAGSPEISGLR